MGGGGSPPQGCKIRDLDGNAKVSVMKSETLVTPLESFDWKGTVSIDQTSSSVISGSVTGSLTRKSTSAVVVQVSQQGTVSCDAQCRPKLKCSTPDCGDHGKFCIDGNCDVENPRIAEARAFLADGDSLFVDELPVDFVSFAQTLGPDFDDRQGTDIIRITRKYKCER
jgi:hypothetical protein